MGNTFARKNPGKGRKRAAPKPPPADGPAAAVGNQDMLKMYKETRGGTDERLRINPEMYGLTHVQCKKAADNPALTGADQGAKQAQIDGKAHPSGPLTEQNMPRQGSLGDAALFGAMLAAARANPELIRDMIKDNYDGTYDVELYVRDDVWSTKMNPVILTIDATFPVSQTLDPLYAQAGRGEDRPELWAMLIEKAYAIHMGRWPGQAEGGQGVVDPDQEQALAMLMGRSEAELDIGELGPEKAMALIDHCVRQGWPLTCVAKEMAEMDPRTAREADLQSLVGGHTYVASSANVDEGKVDLLNPWGALHQKKLSSANLVKWFKTIKVVKSKDRRKGNMQPGASALA
jgi:Calpain family cysteine protease